MSMEKRKKRHKKKRKMREKKEKNFFGGYSEMRNRLGHSLSQQLGGTQRMDGTGRAYTSLILG